VHNELGAVVAKRFRMSINIWKLSTFVCTSLFATAIAANHVPSAAADPTDPVAAEAGGACEDQEHMQAALEGLRVARHELRQAVHDKGGHRGIAVERTTEAIRQLKAGCRFADDRRDSE
jgi:hypothetical protein